MFLTQSEFFNVVRWSNPGGATPTQYKVFRNGQFITTVPVEAKLEVEDHNLKKGATYSYQVIAENGVGTVAEGTINITCN